MYPSNTATQTFGLLSERRNVILEIRIFDLNGKHMICIVYISSAIYGLSDRQILSILRKSKCNNKMLGISGLLLYNCGSFMQLIEGKRTDVERLYEKICLDDRHSGITLLLKEAITQKNFEDWLIGYKDLSKLNAVEQELLTSSIGESLDFSRFIKTPHHSLEFFETFKKILS